MPQALRSGQSGRRGSLRKRSQPQIQSRGEICIQEWKLRSHEHITPIPSSTTRCGPAWSARAAGRRAADRPRHDARPDRRRAEVNGVKFDGVDLFLFDPHVSIDSTRRRPQAARRQASAARSLVVGSLVAPVWPPTGGGSAMGSDEERKAVRRRRSARPARSARSSRDLGIRTYGVIRIDSAASPADWAKDPAGQHQKKIAETFREAADVAEDYGERLAAEGEICWGGMHSWKRKVELLEQVGRPKTVGFQADMAHTLLFTWATTRRRTHPARELRLVRPEDARRGAARR